METCRCTGQPQSVLAHAQYRVVVNECSHDDKEMKKLVTARPNIKPSREKSLRHAQNVESGTKDVENRHQN